jgi:hypothetical protein
VAPGSLSIVNGTDERGKDDHTLSGEILPLDGASGLALDITSKPPSIIEQV